jgi:hypothetical protein
MEACHDNGWCVTARCLMVVVAVCGVVPVAAAQGYFGVDVGTQRGDFGSTVTTTVSALTLSTGWVANDYDVSVAVPLLRMSDDLSAEETGLGDVIVRGGLSNLYRNSNGLTLDASVSIKFPTADENKNLGSGETDLGGFISLRKQWSSFATTLGAGYILVGDPAGVDYNDVTLVSLGVSKRLSRGGMFASLDTRSAVISGTDDPREFGVGGYYVIDAHNALSGSAFVGLSDGSADYGLNLGWLKRF